MYVLSPYLNIYRPDEKNSKEEKSLLIYLYQCRINLFFCKYHTQSANLNVCQYDVCSHFSWMHHQDFPPTVVDPCCKKMIYPFLLSLSLLLLLSQIDITLILNHIFKNSFIILFSGYNLVPPNLLQTPGVGSALPLAMSSQQSFTPYLYPRSQNLIFHVLGRYIRFRHQQNKSLFFELYIIFSQQDNQFSLKWLGVYVGKILSSFSCMMHHHFFLCTIKTI